MSDFNFNLKDKVFIKSLNKEGMIVGRFMNEDGTKYDVLYSDKCLGWQTNYLHAEYLGPKTCSLRVYESDLKKQENDVVDCIDDVMDAMKYTMAGLFPGSANEKDLDRLAEIFGFIPGSIRASVPSTNTPEMTAAVVRSAIQNDCNHSWKTYEGLMTRFDFCEKCDEKRI